MLRQVAMVQSFCMTTNPKSHVSPAEKSVCYPVCLVLPLLVPILYAKTNKYLLSIGLTGRFGIFKKMSTACEEESIYAF